MKQIKQSFVYLHLISVSSYTEYYCGVAVYHGITVVSTDINVVHMCLLGLEQPSLKYLSNYPG